ncbi:MAG: hypothetical protein MI739_03990 [Bacteroidales bacterium]|nr:hypothetical protein [Bacteroidales bacterium]
MFQFGLFATFIPYLLISIAYLGFLGGNALQKNQFINKTDLISEYNITFTDSYVEVTDNTQLCNTQSEIDQNTDLNTTEFTYHTLFNYFRPKIPDYLFSGFILSLPPPVLS